MAVVVLVVVVVVLVGPVHPFHRRGLRGFSPPRSRAQRAAKTDEKRQKPFWWEEECRHQCCFYSTSLLHKNTSMATHQLKAIRRTSIRQNYTFYHQQAIGIGSKAWKTRSWGPLAGSRIKLQPYTNFYLEVYVTKQKFVTQSRSFIAQRW